jgi:ankyrin repeat domain-containing protein 50
MGKFDRFLKSLRSKSPRRPPSPISTAPAAHASAPTPNPASSSLAISTSATARRNSALELAIQKHLETLPKSEKDIFLAASKTINEHDLLGKIREYDAQHARDSSFRPHAERLSKFLRILDRFMGGVSIGIQANPDVSSIIVGGFRVVIDLAIDFVEFFSNLTEMLCQLEDYLTPLAAFAEAGRDSPLAIEALASTYADILDFCQKARNVFVSSDGKRRTWTSWMAFFRQQWDPFKIGFGTIKANMQHHIAVLQLVGHVQQLSNDQIKEREELLNWISPHDHEEAHENIYVKKHPGTGDWLLRTKEFRAWIDSSTSALLWCHGKRESAYKTC